MPTPSLLQAISRRTPIGVDVGDDAIRMIQLCARTQQVRAAAILPLNGDVGRDQHGLRMRMRKSIRRSGFRGTTCVVGAPRTLINVHPLRMPEMPSKELRDSLAWEASDRFSIPHESLQVDGIRTGARYSVNEGDRSEVVLFAMDERLAEPWLEMILEAGLAPVALEPGFCGVARAHSRRYRREQDRERVHVVVDVGSGGSTMMFLRGDRIGFCKTISVGGDALDQAMSTGLGIDLNSASALRRDRRHAAKRDRSIDPAVESGANDATKPLLHDLAAEVGLCLRHCAVAFRGSRPEQIVLSGRDAFEPGLAQVVSERAGVEVVLDDSHGTINGLSGQLEAVGVVDENPSAWTAAMGLAIRNQRVRAQRNERAA